MLFDSEKHEKLSNIEWSKEKALECIQSIYSESLSSLDKDIFWPASKDEDADIESNKTVYFGAAGTIWALDIISSFINEKLPFDKTQLINKVHKDYLLRPDTKEVVPSIFLGEVGILLVKYKFNPSKEIEDKIFVLVQSNIKNKTLEALWGAPGTMIAASFLYDQTKEDRWATLFLDNVKFLISKLKEEESKGELIWEQDMYGKLRRWVGAGHGYFGNIFGILKSSELLDDVDKKYILEHVKTVLKTVSKEDNDMMNFATLQPENPEIKQFTQWCHGAPGIVTSLKNYPADSYVDDCLIKSGELIYKAGPLSKGIALCHGTDGNGIALLQLYKRTNDSKWLVRARSFAMHAMSQRNGRKTLFTGELGLSLYLKMCIEGTDEFPFLDSL